MRPKRIGIVGSRTFPNLLAVRAFVSKIPIGTVIVSGGAEGVDETAAHAGRNCGFTVIEHFPDIRPDMNYGEMCEEFYRRNGVIVSDVDELFAFTEKPDLPGKKGGGTWNCIRQARKAGKPVTIFTK